ncbi:hypothetical protein CEQ90_12485 [Lewinellaceae bacterium SD302]|nr:hypothetical protein CEQ90_12485 [Lewinellaceae bacterium SD302]
MQRFLLLVTILFLTGTATLLAQIRLSVRVDSAIVTTACDDLFSDPDPTYQVSVNGNPAITYDFGANPCFLTAPNENYDTLVNGACNLPATLEVCFSIFDNDGDLIPCFVLPECFEQECVTVSIPVAGTESQENISIQGSSDGELYFSVITEEDTDDFNYICGAVDFGALDYGATLGDGTAGLYDNTCADNLNEIDPDQIGIAFDNDHGVWFTYTTGDDVAGLQYVRLFSDPEGTGDPIDLEVMVFSADSCDGELSRFPLYRRQSNGDDTRIELYCPEPNTTYYILVDGKGATDDTQQGVFSIQIEDAGLPEAGDLRCDATELGVVPEGGSINLPEPHSNFCSGFSDDPPVLPAFISRNSVWVQFIAPSSGHVEIAGTSEDPLGIDLELALYQSTNDACDGNFQHLFSQQDLSTYDNVFEMTCLDPGRPYWVLIDGSAFSGLGYFDITVTDLGDIRPVGMRFDTVCAGESLEVIPGVFYDASGTYMDTVKIGSTNCDSIIVTELLVLDPVVLDLEQIRPAIGPAGTDGEGTASASGGFGDLTITWCDGTTGPTNNNLVAGTVCCVTVVDEKGCMADSCFTVDFVDPLMESFTTAAVLCNGEANGSFTFTVTGGRPDFEYSYIGITDPTIAGSGTSAMAGVPITIDQLPAGQYQVVYQSQFQSITFTVEITEPDLLTIAIDEVTPISCFQACDGNVTVTTSGGTGMLTVDVSSPADFGCPGTYTFTVTDENNCMATVSQELIEPEEFIAEVATFNDVNCFDGSDGAITVTTNGNPSLYQWSNGGSTATITDLSPGLYTLTVTNDDGCQDVISQTISQPASPLGGSIDQIEFITCFDSQDGALQARATGGTGVITFQWSNGQTSPIIDDLGPGFYSVTLTDGLGCEFVVPFSLDAPQPLEASSVGYALRCPDPIDAGFVSIPTVNGGEGPYLYSLDGEFFGMDTVFTGLEAGRYDVVVQDALGCEIVLPTDVTPAPILVADLGQDQQILLGDSLSLNLIANSDDLLYNWSVDPAFQGSRLFVRPQDNLTVFVSVLDTVTDCTASAELRILVDRQPRIYVPTAFSPNGDGVNDFFFPFGGTDVVAIADFRIFGRYGNLVFERSASFEPNDPNNGWDGMVNEKPASMGVYVYSASVTFFDGRTEIVKGEINVIR